MGKTTLGLIILLYALSMILTASVSGGELVRIEIEIIYASNQPLPAEPSLSRLMNQLQSTFSFSSYDLIERNAIELTRGQVGKVGIPGGKYLSIRLEEVSRSRAKLMVKVTEARGELNSTMINMSAGQTVLLGGYKYREGSLIIAIKAIF